MSNEFQGIEEEAFDGIEKALGEVARYRAMQDFAASRGLDERARGYRERGARVMAGILRVCAAVVEGEEEESYEYAVSQGLSGLTWDDWEVYRQAISDHRDLADVLDVFAQDESEGRAAFKRYIQTPRRLRAGEGQGKS